MSEKSFQLKIATPERLVFDVKSFSVTIPTTMGVITVLPNHVPLIAELKAGEIVAHTDHGDELFAVVGGFVEVNKGEVVILTHFAEQASLYHDDMIESARKRADELMKMKFEEDVNFEHFESELERSLTRVKVADKWKMRKYK